MKKAPPPSKIYRTLLQELERLESSLPQSKSIPPDQQLDYYWNWGQVLHRLNQAIPHGQWQETLETLGKRFDKRLRLMFDFQKFYQLFPEGLGNIAHPERLTWSHVRTTFKLKTQTERLFYLNEAAADYAPTRRIEAAVRQGLYHQIQEKSSAKHAQGKLSRDANPLYHYQAKLVEVLDGDTLHLIAEQGFYSQYRLTLRMRGINTPELHGPLAERATAAKQFVQDQLKDLALIYIRTYKTDSFGRYIADVFYHPTWQDPRKIFEKGFFLNQELLDRGLAKMAAY